MRCVDRISFFGESCLTSSVTDDTGWPAWLTSMLTFNNISLSKNPTLSLKGSVPYVRACVSAPPTFVSFVTSQSECRQKASVVEMAALRQEHRYGLSCGKINKNNPNRTLYHVKLTDTAIRTLEAYQNLKVRACPSSLSLLFPAYFFFRLPTTPLEVSLVLHIKRE